METNDWEKLDAALTHGEPEVEKIRIDSPGALVTGGVDDTSKPEFNAYKLTNILPPSAPTSVTSDLYLSLQTESGSPFVIVWEEVSLYVDVPQTDDSASLVVDVPQTGDSASLVPWLLLLSGAFVLLALRRSRFHA